MTHSGECRVDQVKGNGQIKADETSEKTIAYLCCAVRAVQNYDI